MVLGSGEFSERISVGTTTIVFNADGSNTPTTTYVDLWCHVAPKSGSRGLEGSLMDITEHFEIFINYNDFPALSKSNNIVYQARNLTIHSIQIVDARRTYIKIKAAWDENNDVILTDLGRQILTDLEGEYLSES